MDPVPDLFRLPETVVTVYCSSAVQVAAATGVIVGSKQRARGTKHFVPMPIQLPAARYHR